MFSFTQMQMQKKINCPSLIVITLIFVHTPDF
jgi:hypothetical protein